MVAEHIERPTDVVESLSSLIRPGGHVLVFTPNRWSPGSLAARLLPQRWHAPVARWLWDTRAEDVFPTFYRMNTRRRLRALFEAGGFQEVRFVYLDNCSVLQRFRATCYLELCLWRVFRAVKVPYPENDLLGIYVKLG
jgi:SAM-dependent methyltransferase